MTTPESIMGAAYAEFLANGGWQDCENFRVAFKAGFGVRAAVPAAPVVSALPPAKEFCELQKPAWAVTADWMRGWNDYRTIHLAALSASPLMANGLTQAETSETASVSDLSGRVVPALNDAPIAEISRLLNVMIASATEHHEGDEVTGYTIKTGSLHKIIGILSNAGHPVTIPLGLPVAERFTAYVKSSMDQSDQTGGFREKESLDEVLAKIEVFKTELRKDPIKLRQWYVDAGVLTETGELAEQYGGPALAAQVAPQAPTEPVAEVVESIVEKRGHKCTFRELKWLVPEPPPVGTFLYTHPLAERATAETPDDSVTPEYLEWLRTMARREGVAGNEAWNAGVAFATRSQEGFISAPVEPTALTLSRVLQSLESVGVSAGAKKWILNDLATTAVKEDQK